MPEWLIFGCAGLCVLVGLGFLFRLVYHHGYEDGMTQAQEFGHYVDEVMTDVDKPPFPPRL